MITIRLKPLPSLRITLEEEHSEGSGRFNVTCSVDRGVVDHCRLNPREVPWLWHRITADLEAAFVKLLTPTEEDEETAHRREIADSQGH